MPRTRIQTSPRCCAYSDRPTFYGQVSDVCDLVRQLRQVAAFTHTKIVAHGNTLRAMVKYLDKIADDKIPAVNIPTGVPIVYKLDDALVPVDRSHSFGDVRV